MGLFSDIWNSVKATIAKTDYSGYDALFSANDTLNIKRVALDTCSAYLARLVSKGTFVFKEEGLITDKEIDSGLKYALNVRPNPNQTSSEFKISMVKKLINGELLVIKDKNNFFVADNFVINYSLDGNSFTGVTVDFSADNVANAPNSGPYSQKYINRTFFQGTDCFYLKNDNEGLNQYTNGLWGDYGKLFGILITNQLRVGQVRAKLNIPVANKLEDNEKEKLQKQFVEKLSKSMVSDPVVLIPDNAQAKSSYDEISASKSASLQNQINDFGNLIKIFIGQVSGLLGIPPALILGETANNSENLDLAIESAVIPIANKICEGLASLIIKESGFKAGKTLELTGFKTINLLDRADAIDKVGSSGVVKVNEVREAIHLPPDPEGDRFIMTKNYQKEGANSENT